eukprot:1159946-Pelagomonas_calceolata.AAC.8
MSCFSLPWTSPLLGQPSPRYPKQRCSILRGKSCHARLAHARPGIARAAASTAAAVVASGEGKSHYSGSGGKGHQGPQAGIRQNK